MSSAPEAHASPHGHDDHHAGDGEPVQSLPADEPRTPGWIPALGLALFVGCAIALLASGTDETKPVAVAAIEAAAPVAPSPPPRTAPALAAPAGSAAPMQRTPEQLAEVRKKIIEARARASGQPAAPPAPPAPAR